MGPRKVHKLKLGKYLFIREFLTKEWSVTDEERGNVDTYDNASIDAVWDSFQHFLEINGYAPDFCSKILLGKLLHEAGVEKVKRGPRRRQKFYYFPLKPVNGSKAQAILASNSDARYDASTTSCRLKKVKPEYYTLSTESLGRVSVGVLHDRSISPEKYATKVLKRSLRRRTVKNENFHPNFNTADDLRSPSSWPVDSSVSDKNDSGFDTYTEEWNVLGLKSVEPEQSSQVYSHNQESDSCPNYDAHPHGSSEFQYDNFGADDGNLSTLVAQSLSRIYDSDDIHESYFQLQNSDPLSWEKENNPCSPCDDHCRKRISYRSVKNTSFQVENFGLGAGGSSLSRRELASGDMSHYDQTFDPKTNRMMMSSRMTQITFYEGHSEKFNDATYKGKNCYNDEWDGISESSHLYSPPSTAQNQSNACSLLSDHLFAQHDLNKKVEQQKANQKKRENYCDTWKKESRKRISEESIHHQSVNSVSSKGNNELLAPENSSKIEIAGKSSNGQTAFKRPRGRPKGSKNKKKASGNLPQIAQDAKLSSKLGKSTKKSRRFQKPNTDHERSRARNSSLNTKSKTGSDDPELEVVNIRMPKKYKNRAWSSSHLCQQTNKDPFMLDTSYKSKGFSKDETVLGIACSSPPSPVSTGITYLCTENQPFNSSDPGFRNSSYPSTSLEAVLCTSGRSDRAGLQGSSPPPSEVHPPSSNTLNVDLTYK